MRTAKAIADDIQESTGDVIDPKFFETVAAYAHFGMMFTVTTALGLLGNRFEHRIYGTVAGLVVCLIYASVHEFWYDPKYENAVTRGSDLVDFAWLMGGSAVACLFLLLLL